MEMPPGAVAADRCSSAVNAWLPTAAAMSSASGRSAQAGAAGARAIRSARRSSSFRDVRREREIAC